MKSITLALVVVVLILFVILLCLVGCLLLYIGVVFSCIALSEGEFWLTKITRFTPEFWEMLGIGIVSCLLAVGCFGGAYLILKKSLEIYWANQDEGLDKPPLIEPNWLDRENEAQSTDNPADKV